MDIRVPRLDGLNALRIIRRIAPRLPVVMFTGQAGQGDMLESTRLGAATSLLKPILIDKLETVLRYALSHGVAYRWRSSALKHIRIGNKLIALVGVFVAGLLALGGVAHHTLSRAQVNGPIYRELVEKKDIIADTRPPPLYIIEPYCCVIDIQGELENGAPAAEIEPLIEHHMALARRRDAEAAGLVIHGEIEALYLEHRARIAVAVQQTKAGNAVLEAATAAEVQSETISMIAIGLGAIVIGVVFGWWIGRGITTPVRAMPVVAAQMRANLADALRQVAGSTDKVSTEPERSARSASEGIRLAVQTIDGMQRVSDAAEQAERNGASAEQMAQLSEQVVTGFDSVSSVVEQNVATAEQMAASATEVTGSTESIVSVSKENSAAVEEDSASAEEMNDQVQEVAQNAQRLAEMAAELRRLVSRFKLLADNVPAPAGHTLRVHANRPVAVKGQPT